MEYLLILARIKRVFEFHFCSLKEDFVKNQTYSYLLIVSLTRDMISSGVIEVMQR